MVTIDRLAVDIAKYFIVVPVLVAVVVFIDIEERKERLKFIGLVVASGALSILLAKISSHMVHDPRPFVVGHFTPLIPHTADNGFPSDHVLLASLLGWISLRYSKALGISSLIIAALIGAARMKVGVHHLEDVIGSFVITGVATLIVGLVIKLLSPHKESSQKN